MGLFSTTHIHNTKTVESTKLVPYEKTVIEKRAPTDDSIRLSEEYHEKTEKRFMQAFKLSGNNLDLGINANVFVFEDERTTGITDNPSIKYITEFELNGKKTRLKFQLDPFEVRELSRMETREADGTILKRVFKKLSEVIALELIRAQETKVIGLTENYTLR